MGVLTSQVTQGPWEAVLAGVTAAAVCLRASQPHGVSNTVVGRATSERSLVTRMTRRHSRQPDPYNLRS